MHLKCAWSKGYYKVQISAKSTGARVYKSTRVLLVYVNNKRTLFISLYIFLYSLVHFSEVLGHDRSLTSLILVLQERAVTFHMSAITKGFHTHASCVQGTQHSTVHIKPFWVPYRTVSHCILESVTCIFPKLHLNITPHQRCWLVCVPNIRLSGHQVPTVPMFLDPWWWL